MVFEGRAERARESEEEVATGRATDLTLDLTLGFRPLFAGVRVSPAVQLSIYLKAYHAGLGALERYVAETGALPEQVRVMLDCRTNKVTTKVRGTHEVTYDVGP